MNNSQKTLIRLMRMAVGCDDVEPMTLKERVWAQVYWVMGTGTLVHSLGSMNLSPMIRKDDWRCGILAVSK